MSEILWINIVIETDCNQCDRPTQQTLTIDECDFDDLDEIRSEIARAVLDEEGRPGTLCKRCCSKFRAEVEASDGGGNPYLNKNAGGSLGV